MTPTHSEDVVTYGWLQRQALLWLGGIFLAAVAATWRLSAQTTELKRDVQEAKEAIPRIEAQLQALTAAVQRGNHTQDSMVTLMTDRERRAR